MPNYNPEDNSYTIEKSDGAVVECFKLARNIADFSNKPLVLRIPDMKIEFEILPQSTENNVLDSYISSWQKAQPSGVVKGNTIIVESTSNRSLIK